MKLLLSVAFLVSIAIAVEGFPSGAPAAACDTLLPNPASHGAQPQTVQNPYSVDISAFDDGNGGFEYNLGGTYTLTVSGGSGEQFRGVLVQARQVSNDANRVGVFTVTEPLTRLSSCPVSTDGITHNSAVDKTTVSFNWTAPMAETGDIRFGFAVVQQRITYWADQRTVAISQVGATPGPTTVGPTTVGPTGTTMAPEMTTASATSMTTTMAPEMTTASATSITSFGVWALIGTAIIAALKVIV